VLTLSSLLDRVSLGSNQLKESVNNILPNPTEVQNGYKEKFMKSESKYYPHR